MVVVPFVALYKKERALNFKVVSSISCSLCTPARRQRFPLKAADVSSKSPCLEPMHWNQSLVGDTEKCNKKDSGGGGGGGGGQF